MGGYFLVKNWGRATVSFAVHRLPDVSRWTRGSFRAAEFFTLFPSIAIFYTFGWWRLGW